MGLTALNPSFIPLLSVGGWAAGSEVFSVMAADPVKRTNFVDSVVPFLNEFGFRLTNWNRFLHVLGIEKFN